MLSAIVLAPAPSAAVPEIVEAPIRFDVAATEIIPGIAAVHASCGIVASGEPLRLLNNETDLTTIAAAPGPCAIVLSVVGTEVGLPIVNTTPLGRNAFYVPGVATLSFGIVDVSVDLQTALNGTARIADAAAASVAPSELVWSAWGVQRVVVDATDGRGSVLGTELVTSFTYAMSIGLTVYALNLPLFHADLVQVGVFPGSRALSTTLVVDLLPPPLVLGDPYEINEDGATFGWSGDVAADADHLDLVLSDGALTMSFRVADANATSVRVPLRADTSYEARILVVDDAGQSSASNVVAFRTSPGGSSTDAGVVPLGDSVLPWAALGLAVLVAVIAVAALRPRRRE